MDVSTVPFRLIAGEDIPAGSSIGVIAKIPTGALIDDHLRSGETYRAFVKRQSIDWHCIGATVDSLREGDHLRRGKLSKWYLEPEGL